MDRYVKDGWQHRAHARPHSFLPLHMDFCNMNIRNGMVPLDNSALERGRVRDTHLQASEFRLRV